MIQNTLSIFRADNQHKLADWFEENVDECLTVIDCPPEVQRRLGTSNIMECINRQLKRRTRIYRDMAYISQFWPGVSAVIRVDSLRYDKSNDEYKGLETRFYITSLHHVEASQFTRWIRAHWGIENQLHRVLDMAFNEDASQKRSGYSAENFSRLLRFARNILRRYKDTHPTKLSYLSMKFKAALQEDFALEVLKSVFV
ncbi:MAG: ISAs1 family transposase [Akkermansia sp.]|nr:ISAs1 family transposase [Akkermansia sp.]